MQRDLIICKSCAIKSLGYHQHACQQIVDELVKVGCLSNREPLCICGHGAEAHANTQTECNGIECKCRDFVLDCESVRP
jgi:hypothetical protein